MHAFRACRAHIALRSARAAPSLRTERRPKGRRETKTTTGDRTRENPRRRRAHAARERPCSTAAVMKHPRCRRAARVAPPVALRSARAAPSLRTERRPKRRRETRTTTDDRSREEPRRRRAPQRATPQLGCGGENHPRRRALAPRHGAYSGLPWVPLTELAIRRRCDTLMVLSNAQL